MNAWRLGWCVIAWMVVGGAAMAQDSFRIFSSDFAPGQPIPAKYTQRHGNRSPALEIDGTPARTKTLVLIVDDPDAPTPLFTHWVVWNIDPHHVIFREGRAPQGAVQGTNSFGHAGYDGPNPPSGTHRYFFRLYALDTRLKLDAGADRAALTAAMQGHQIAKAEMFGTYKR